MRLSRVGRVLYGSDPPRSAPTAVAYCSCGLVIARRSDDAAEHAFERHQAEPEQVWIR